MNLKNLLFTVFVRFGHFGLLQAQEHRKIPLTNEQDTFGSYDAQQMMVNSITNPKIKRLSIGLKARGAQCGLGGIAQYTLPILNNHFAHHTLNILPTPTTTQRLMVILSILNLAQRSILESQVKDYTWAWENRV